MSQLPSIHTTGGRGALSTPEPPKESLASRQGAPLETLRNLTANGALSAETRRKLASVLRSAERERERSTGGASNCVSSSTRTPDHQGSPASPASLASSNRRHLTPLNLDVEVPCSRSWLNSVNDGVAPQLRQMSEEMMPVSELIRAKNFDVSELPFRGRPAVGSASGAPDFSRRASPALQDPQETFEKLNKALTYTMRYVEEVTELDFDIAHIKEYDGSPMEDKERLFLSVCCSSIANFALCTRLSIDLRKLAHFLADIYKYYSAVNPYHNAIHAADCFQMASLFFRDPAVNFLFSDEEILLCFLAVLALDVSHPGVSTTTLAELSHPLVTVYGDIAAKEQSSLLVFMHQLFLDDNFFLNFDSPNLITIRSRSLLREALYDIVLPSAPRRRPLISSELARISGQRMVRLSDVNRLLCAILLLCHNAFALRSSFMALTWATWWYNELQREDEERQRQFLRGLLPSNPSGGTAQLTADYCDVVVGAVADAVRALVPTDLYDNLERNRDAAALRTSAMVSVTSSGSGVFSSGNPNQEPQTPAPYASAAAEDVRNGVPVSAWTDTTSDVMEILKKAAAHANSLDRKASRGAILNASPPRSSTAVSKEWRAAGTNNVGGRRSSGSSVVFGASVTSCGPADDDDARRAEGGVQPQLHPSRSEHYFSFLRLYDEFERDGRSAAEFAGQLVFLALQLDPSYISSSAREKFGDGCSAATCVAMAEFIRDTEEAPSTAEAIATTRVPSSLFVAAEETKHTDSFILYLFEMYNKRDAATTAAAQAMMEEGCDDSDLSTGTSPPPSDPNNDRDDSPTDDADVRGHRPALPPMPQRDSPIRKPVGTDSSAVRAFLNAHHPLVEDSQARSFEAHSTQKP